uniref:winged helix-turn-helix domain-containing protein n=1 Tax=Thiolapillus sp. TaxID=2017437 RepID=UPI003AF4B436
LDEAFDIVILDLGLPGLDGLEVLRALRDRKKDVPVLILTAKDALDDRVRGLDLGADDYLTKPFDLDELAARLRSLIRRSHGRSVTLLEFAEISLDPAAQTVSKGGKDVELTLKEFKVLRCLMENRGRVISRRRLEETVYGWDAEIGSNALEVHVHNLRKKLGQGLIKTVRGLGYRIG